MKVKYALALALSHRARLLVLDEPTKRAGIPFPGTNCWRSFSSLPRTKASASCFPRISPPTWKNAPTTSYTCGGARWRQTQTRTHCAPVPHSRTDSRAAGRCGPEGLLLGCKREREGFSALLRAEDAPRLGADTAPASLEDIMVHLEKEDGGL